MKYHIDLSSHKSTSSLDHAVYFLLHYLRYILVITQLVVLGVLFYRFKIDQDISDLKYSLRQKQGFMSVAKPLMAQANIVNLQFSAVTGILNSQVTLAESIRYVLQSYPNDLFLTKLSVQNDTLELVGVTTNLQQLQSYYQKLKKENNFSTINLTKVDRRDFGYSFTLYLSGLKKN